MGRDLIPHCSTAGVEEGFREVRPVVWEAYFCKSICVVEMQEEVSPFPRSCAVLLVAFRWREGRHLLRNRVGLLVARARARARGAATDPAAGGRYPWFQLPSKWRAYHPQGVCRKMADPLFHLKQRAAAERDTRQRLKLEVSESQGQAYETRPSWICCCTCCAEEHARDLHA